MVTVKSSQLDERKFDLDLQRVGQQNLQVRIKASTKPLPSTKDLKPEALLQLKY